MEKLWRISLIFIIVSCFISCGSREDHIGSNSTLHLKLGHDMPIDSDRHIAVVRFAEMINHRTNGKVQIDIFPEQQLGNDHQMIQKSLRDEIDIIFPPTSKLVSLVPEMKILDLPYLFNSKENLYIALDKFLGKFLSDSLLKHKLVGLNIFEGGFKQILSSQKITSIEDFKEQNFRIMKSDLLKDQFSRLQSRPIHIDFYQINKAFKDKSIDACENPINTIASMSLDENAKYILESNHAYLGQYLIITKSALNKIPNEFHSLIYDASKKALSYQRKLAMSNEEKNKKLLKKRNVIFTQPTKSLVKRLKKNWAPLADEFRTQYPMLFKQIDKMKTISDDVLILGLDLSLSGLTAPSGEAIKMGVELALKEINESGGIRGKKLQVIAKNNGGFPSKGLRNVNQFLENKNLVAIMGGMHSPVALKQLKTIHENKVPFLIPWAAATKIVSNEYTPNFVFRFSVRDEYAGSFLINQALKKYQRIALLLENTGWGKSNEIAMKDALKKHNLSPTTIQYFSWGQQDFKNQFNAILAHNSQAIVFVGNAPEGGVVVKQLVDNKINIPVISHWGITGGNFYKLNKEYLSKIDFSFLQTYILSERSKNERVMKFIKKIKENYPGRDEFLVAPVGVIHAYELTHIFANALRNAKNFSGNEIRIALKKEAKHVGVFRNYFTPFKELQEALTIKDFTLAGFNQNGLIEEVSFE